MLTCVNGCHRRFLRVSVTVCLGKGTEIDMGVDGREHMAWMSNGIE